MSCTVIGLWCTVHRQAISFCDLPLFLWSSLIQKRIDFSNPLLLIMWPKYDSFCFLIMAFSDVCCQTCSMMDTLVIWLSMVFWALFSSTNVGIHGFVLSHYFLMSMIHSHMLLIEIPEPLPVLLLSSLICLCLPRYCLALSLVLCQVPFCVLLVLCSLHSLL